MLTLTIKASTTTDAIEGAIPFRDMREHAITLRDLELGAALIPEDYEEVAAELHEIDGVTVLWSPEFGYAYVNEDGPGAGNSLLIDERECPTPEYAARVWRRTANA